MGHVNLLNGGSHFTVYNISKYHIIYFKNVQFLFVHYTLVKLEKNTNFNDVAVLPLK